MFRFMGMVVLIFEPGSLATLAEPLLAEDGVYPAGPASRNFEQPVA